MSLGARQRKAQLMMVGRTQQEIADACGVDHSLVSRVLAGTRTGGPKAQRVMKHVAALLNAPLHEVFPDQSKAA
jgi:transcriptional regulator with XRE-family HTH domain